MLKYSNSPSRARKSCQAEVTNTCIVAEMEWGRTSTGYPMWHCTTCSVSSGVSTQSFTKLILKNGVVEVQQMSTLELGVAVRAINTALQKQADLCGCRAEATLSVGRSVVLRGRLGQMESSISRLLKAESE